MLYRITLSGPVNNGCLSDTIQSLLDSLSIQGFTCWSANGYWQDQYKYSYVVEIDSLKANLREQVHRLASQLRDLYQQDNVLVQEIASASLLI